MQRIKPSIALGNRFLPPRAVGRMVEAVLQTTTQPDTDLHGVRFDRFCFQSLDDELLQGGLQEIEKGFVLGSVGHDRPPWGVYEHILNLFQKFRKIAIMQELWTN